MNLYFDTEFTGLHKNTTLISLGIVSENGKKFYAEFMDFNPNQCDEWIQNSVLTNLYLNPIPWSNTVGKRIEEMKAQEYDISEIPNIPNENSYLMYFIAHTADNGTREVCGDSLWISEQLKKWLQQFDSVQFVSDVCHYDFVLLIDLFGTAWDLPKNVNPACHDINQDIANYYHISENKAFDKSREDVVLELYGKQIDGNKHNSLYDAEVIKAIYNKIR